MKRSSLITFIYALIILVGGLIGHLKANSLMSLIMGSAFAILLFAAAILLYLGRREGLLCSIILLLVLDGFFSYRFLHTHKFMPSGLMALLTLFTLGLLVIDFRKART